MEKARRLIRGGDSPRVLGKKTMRSVSKGKLAAATTTLSVDETEHDHYEAGDKKPATSDAKE